MRSISSVLLIFLCSCTGSTIQKYSKFQNTSWAASQNVNSHFVIKESGKYDLSIDLRNTDDYAFSNIWTVVRLTSNSANVFIDRYNFTLADQEGRWLGSGPGIIHDNRFEIKHGIELKQGEYNLVISQDMRAENLAGIVDAGVFLKSSK